MKGTKIGALIEALLDKGLSQRDIAEKVCPEMDIKVAQWYISRWKHGHDLKRLELFHCQRLSDMAGVDFNHTFNYKKPNTTHTKNNDTTSKNNKKPIRK